MGYYTRFNLTVQVPSTLGVPASFVTGQVADWIRKNEEANFALSYDDFSSQEPAKWYDCKSDLRDLSEQLPGSLFIMECMGEDGRHWRIYAKDGRAEEVLATTVWKVPKFAEQCPACASGDPGPHKNCVLR